MLTREEYRAKSNDLIARLEAISAEALALSETAYDDARKTGGPHASLWQAYDRLAADVAEIAEYYKGS